MTELKRIEDEREELLGKVEQLARSDSLTGLPNRRSLEELMPREMARARRARSPLCLAVIDVDFFKVYNDTHGHLAGDSLLRKCAIAWDQELRAEDSLFRFGGEEFVVVLPDCTSSRAARSSNASAPPPATARPSRSESPSGTSRSAGSL